MGNCSSIKKSGSSNHRHFPSQVNLPSTAGASRNLPPYETTFSRPLSPLSPRSVSSDESPSRANSLQRNPLPLREFERQFAHLPSDMKNALRQGKRFRASDSDRQAILGAWQLPAYRLTQLQERFQELIEDNRDLRGTNWIDMVALNMWTQEDHFQDVQNAFSNPDAPEAVRESGFLLAKGMISALNSLPDRYNYQGLVYSGRRLDEDREKNWVKEDYFAGQPILGNRFHCGAQKCAYALPRREVIFETNSYSGKNIGDFSVMPHELEVIFPPGTRFMVDSVSRVEYSPSGPEFLQDAAIRVRQTQM